MWRRRYRRRMPWIALIALAIFERWMHRERRGYPRHQRQHFSLARMLLLERVGYYSPWLIGARFLAGLFRRRGGGGAIV